MPIVFIHNSCYEYFKYYNLLRYQSIISIGLGEDANEYNKNDAICRINNALHEHCRTAVNCRDHN